MMKIWYETNYISLFQAIKKIRQEINLPIGRIYRKKPEFKDIKEIKLS